MTSGALVRGVSSQQQAVRAEEASESVTASRGAGHAGMRRSEMAMGLDGPSKVACGTVGWACGEVR